MDSVPHPDSHKKCSKCLQEKPLAEFYIDKRRQRHYSWCKTCHGKMMTSWGAEHQESVADIQRRYRNSHRAERNAADRARDATSEVKAKKAIYRETRREERNAKSRAYYAANKEKHTESVGAWVASHPDVVKASDHKRRAKRTGAEGYWTAAEWQEIKAAQDYRCLMCGKREPEIKLTADHIIPLSGGGANSADNIQGLCGTCNRRKGNKQ